MCLILMLNISKALLGTAKSGGPLNANHLHLEEAAAVDGGGELLFLPLLADYITDCTVGDLTHTLPCKKNLFFWPFMKQNGVYSN